MPNLHFNLNPPKDYGEKEGDDPKRRKPRVASYGVQLQTEEPRTCVSWDIDT